MGNGSRLTIDILSLDDLEKAAARAAANFGHPTMIIMPFQVFTTMDWHINPEFSGTPWSDTARMTKRERAVAGLHTTLVKLRVLKFSEEEFMQIRNLSMKRLKRARWARYQQGKVK